MTSKFIFNFEETVAQAKKDFPEQLAKATFVDISQPDAQDKIEAFIESLPEAQKKSVLLSREKDSSFLRVDNNIHDSQALKFSDGSAIVIASSVAENHTKVAFDDANKDAYYVFQHELGHVVVENANKVTNYSENAADTFSIIRGIKEGIITKQDAKAVADNRIWSMLLNDDLVHFTTMGVDSLIINPKNTDFVSLSNKEIAKLAEKHAETFSLSGENKEVQSTFLRSLHVEAPVSTTAELLQERLLNLANVSMNAKKDSMEFYIASRVINNAFAKVEKGELDGINMKGDFWDHVKKTIEEKGGHRDIGAKKALEVSEFTREESMISRMKNTVSSLKI